MTTFTTKEDMFFAECLPITIYRDGAPILAVVGELGPAEGASDRDRALAEEVRRNLSAAPEMLAALKALADVNASNNSPKRIREIAIAAITKAEGRADG